MEYFLLVDKKATLKSQPLFQFIYMVMLCTRVAIEDYVKPRSGKYITIFPR